MLLGHGLGGKGLDGDGGGGGVGGGSGHWSEKRDNVCSCVGDWGQASRDRWKDGK